MDYLRSDNILREILEDRKTLMGFLDAVFGFMSRNTDFYHIQNTKDDALGFPRGVKEQILLSCMQKYEYTFKKPIMDPLVEEHSFVAEEIEIVADECNELCNKSQQHAAGQNIRKLETSEDNSCSTNTTKFSESDYKNGSEFKNYCWSQTLKDVEISILLPSEVKLGKHIKVDLKPNYITIKVLHPKQEILISGETWDKYKHNDVLWSISDGKLIISFEKLKECWWDKLLSIEKSINIKTIDTESSINDYSPSLQKAIQKLRAQDVKEISPIEMEQMTRLRQAWNAEGSPFKGQPFDPSVIQFN